MKMKFWVKGDGGGGGGWGGGGGGMGGGERGEWAGCPLNPKKLLWIRPLYKINLKRQIRKSRTLSRVTSFLRVIVDSHYLKHW